MSDLQQVYANAPKMLWDAQQKYEQNIIEYTKAREYWVECSYTYEKKFAEQIPVHKIAGITIAKELAKGDCLDEYKAMLDAETLKKKFRYFIKAGEEKINTIKAIMRVHTGKVN